MPVMPPSSSKAPPVKRLVLDQRRALVPDDIAISGLIIRAEVDHSLAGCPTFHIVSEGQAVVILASISWEADLHGGTN